MSWDVHRLPRAEGRNFLVTGANAGIGYFVAEQLARTGATVILACRNPGKAAAAITSIRTHVPDARLQHLHLDLSDLSSIKSTADALEAPVLDAVVCNAGVLTEDAELMFTTNHLGHFALLGHLAPRITGRVVTTGSLVAKSARWDGDQERTAKDAYARSKLAQMLFGFELDRRLRAAGSPVLSVVNHPGGALDSLTPSRPRVHVRTAGQRLRGLPAGILLQGKEAGAWPAVRAVLDPGVRGGQLWRPRRFGLRGVPGNEVVQGQLADTALASEVWAISVDRTGIEPFSLGAKSAAGPG